MSELKVVIGMNEGKVLCISNDKRIIKSAMFDYLFETNQEFDVDFFELRNWGEYDIEIFNYEHQPTLNENQQILLEWLKDYYKENRPFTTAFGAISNVASRRWKNLTDNQQAQVLQAFSACALEQEAE